MFPKKTCLAALAATLIAALWPGAAALAQTPPAARPDPVDARAATAPLVHRSALSGYRRLGAETPPIAWRDANDAVERIGGWRAYAREAHGAAAPTPTAPASAPAARAR